ncbi:MAG: ArnT family glycosyltransferase, partial [Thermoanaerobaculia bacterium]
MMPASQRDGLPRRSHDRWWLAAVLLTAIGVVRIVLTYSVFTATSDEPTHIASGIEWLTGVRGDDPEHPPLARVAAALPLFLSGVRPSGSRNASGLREEGRWDAIILARAGLNAQQQEVGDPSLSSEGRALLYANGNYERSLSIARLGILPFFVVASVIVWTWASRLLGRGAGLAAVALFTSLPPVLAHSGLATTDMAFTTTLLGSVYAFVLWLDSPNLRRSLMLGALTGLAVLSKFSAFLFLPAIVVSLTGLRWLARKSIPSDAVETSRWRLRPAIVVAAVAFLMIWAGYGFSVRPATKSERRPHTTIVRSLGLEQFLSRHGNLRETAFTIMEAPFPAGELLDGAVTAWMHNRHGHPAYLFGEIRENGWWYFFPVVLAVKTPLGFSLLAGVGLFFLMRKRNEVGWEAWAPFVSASVILLVVLPSRINIGVRHVLPMYPFLSIVAGYGVARLLSAPRRAAAVTAGTVLLLWHVVSSAMAHPDYLPYFNELSFGRPERITLDSDLDWGQDLKRLGQRLRQLGADRVAVGGLDTDYLEKVMGIRARSLVPYEPTTGRVAISEHYLKVKAERFPREMGRSDRAFAWLERQPTFERVGQSIRLYWIEP